MRLSLNGNDWLFKEFYGEDWRWRDAHKPDTHDTRFWKQGSVPGSVHHDLWMAGEIPNPYFERNSLLLEWIPARTWIYKKTFHVDESLKGKRLQLCFEGVDYAAEFFLNGESLGSHVGMYTPASFEVSEQLHYGAGNLIAVVIAPAPHEQPQVSRSSLVRTHKSRMTYWWDFCPRMIHVGIWDNVYLEVSGQVRIADVFIRPQLDNNFERVDISVSMELDALQNEAVIVEINLRLDGEIAAIFNNRHALANGHTSLNHSLTVANPKLWFPNGYGDQPLYEAEINIRTEETILDQRTVMFGIRKVELIPNENSDPNALPYTLRVNGRKVYIKGWNWVPLDVMYGVPRPEKLEHLFRLAKLASVNMLRVWGGGLIEKETFYHLADRLGMMVWQEFIQSSSGIENTPSDDPDFIQMMVEEAEQIIPRKRNHPSLVLWGGGNELSGASEQPLDDTHPLLAALKAAVNQLDPDRLWLATSPTGRVFGNTLENIERDPLSLHDVHGPWEYQGVTAQYTLYNKSTSLLHSEFGVEGITNLKSLNATIAPEHQHPVSLDNPYWFHLGAWWNKVPMWREVFGEIEDVATLLRATQYMQASGLQYAVEADRRRQYQNSGTLPWQFNEPYPMATCTSAVDYYGQAKPSYYVVKGAYEAVHVSAKFPTAAWGNQSTFTAEIWVNNSYERAFSNAFLQVRLINVKGEIHAAWDEQVNFGGNGASAVFAVNWELTPLTEEVFFLDVKLSHADQMLSQNRYVFTRHTNLAPLLNVPATQVTVELEVTEDKWRLTFNNTGETTAMFVWLEDARQVDTAGHIYFSDNHFCLFPDETRSISTLWRDVAPAERTLSIQAWNTEKLTIAEGENGVAQ